ncbi:MAG: hypothetical protein B1H03_00635 [Planctomycetales bacterium 4484_113]|nr:MAG: hypothetical protein B1H03_00635 [Planctomycetales bacterium 4484_113]
MKSHTDTTSLTTRLSSKLAAEAKRLARSRNVSLNRLIADALRSELEREKLKLAREGYAYYAAEDAAEVEQGMAEWSELLEREDAR